MLEYAAGNLCFELVWREEKQVEFFFPIRKIYSMSSTELNEFIENEYELLEDEEWDTFSLMNGKQHMQFDHFEYLKF